MTTEKMPIGEASTFLAKAQKELEEAMRILEEAEREIEEFERNFEKTREAEWDIYESIMEGE